jgi:outer membrane protein assembly factor BamB
MNQPESSTSTRTKGSKLNRQWPLMISVCFVAIITALNLVDFGNFDGGPIIRMLSDKAVIHLITLGGALISLGFAAYWFFVLSRVPRSLRWLAALVAASAVVALAACFRVESMRADFVPQFRPRWTKTHDRELAPIQVAVKEVDLRKTSPQDFPQFLGPHRSLYMVGRNLATDWSKNSPKKLWSQPIGAGWSAFSAVNGFAVTQEQRGDEELVTCYDIKTGEAVWTNGIKARHVTTLGYVGPRGTPTIYRGDVYTLGATGILQRIEGATGKTIWQKDLLAEAKSDPIQEAESIAWGRAASPLIIEYQVIVPLGGSNRGKKVSLAAFDLETGEKKWEAGDRQASYASPKYVSVNDIRMILSVNENNVSAHAPGTGKLLWEYPWPGNSTGSANCSEPMVINSDSVLLSKGYGQGAMLIRILPEGDSKESFKQEVVWTNPRALRTKLTNVCVDDDFAFGLSDGILQCVNARSGEIEWKAPKRFGNGQVLGYDRSLLVQSESGEITLAVLNAERFIERGSFQGLDPNTGPCWNNMCLYGNLLLLRNSQQAACWELPKAGDDTLAARP